jgi:glyoxalase family protein
MQLHGIHHVTAVTGNAIANHAFYTRTLGMRLVKKTVNQDDVSAYHLFYADGRGSPGTDLTFFEWPLPRERRGTRSIARTGLRVAGEASLRWWEDRLSAAGLTHATASGTDGRPELDFEDPEGQRLRLVLDEGATDPAHPWAGSPVPGEHQIRGLGPVTLSIPALAPTDRVLTSVLGFRKLREGARGKAVVHVYAMGGVGPGAEIHVAVEPELAAVRQGAGGVHHVAFRTTAADYVAWAEHLERTGMPSSGPVNRYYFQSLYFREPSGILFEIATDEPGFAVDEPEESLGEKLALPPFLEGQRTRIEAGLKALTTAPARG